MNVHLRPIQLDDLEDFYCLIRNNRTILEAYLPITTRASKDLASTEHYLHDLVEKREQKEWYTMVIEHESQLVGIIYIKSINWMIAKCELGYFMDEDFQGKGLMTQAVKQAIDYCFDTLRMHKIFARIGTENLASKQVALKAGFILEGVLKDDYRTGEGKLVDVEYYGLINSYSK